MSRPEITRRARGEIARILAHSETEFGREARDRYEFLIFTAIADVGTAPNRPGSRARPEFGRNTRSWHLRLSRERAWTPTGIVKQPRHFLLYYEKGGVVFITRLLHERQDTRRQFAK